MVESEDNPKTQLQSLPRASLNHSRNPSKNSVAATGLQQPRPSNVGFTVTMNLARGGRERGEPTASPSLLSHRESKRGRGAFWAI